MKHELKTWPEYWQAVFEDKKTFEVRKNDRDFNVDDVLYLREWDPKRGDYTGRVTKRVVTYILDHPDFVKDGYVILGMQWFCA